MTKASDNPFPSLLFDESDPPAAPATGYRRLYLNGSNVNVIGSNSTIRPLAWADAVGGGGDVATDAIWDAAGDLAVGTGANTAARLAIGNAGATLARINGAVAWNAGTAFPTAATGDRYWRTDRGIEYYYDGSQWLSVQLFRESLIASDSISPVSATAVVARHPLWNAEYDVYLEKLYCLVFSSALSGTAYWTVEAFKGTQAASYTSLGSFNNSADTNANWYNKVITVNAALGTTQRVIYLAATKTSTPGNLYLGASMTYRLIG